MVAKNSVLINLIERYDYGGAYVLLREFGLKDTDIAILLDSCRYAVNFDFETSRKKLKTISVKMKVDKEVVWIEKNLNKLLEGEPNAMFSELVDNIYFQLVNEEFIDFLGRIYRLKEAIFKYLFVSLNTSKKRFPFHDDDMQRRQIYRLLKNKYGIHSYNIMVAITKYLEKYHTDDEQIQMVLEILNSKRMDELMDLRNESIVGHGFMSVSHEDIFTAYGNPEDIIKDFSKCLDIIGIKLKVNKYDKINEIIKSKLDIVVEPTIEDL